MFNIHEEIAILNLLDFCEKLCCKENKKLHL